MMNIALLNRLVFRTPARAYKNKDTVDLDSIREALYLASPVLTEEIGKYERGQIKDEKELKKIRESIYKYYSRSCTRSTPFGLFAGVGTCEWGDKSEVLLADEKIRETRLDMNYVCALGQYIASVDEIRDHLLFYPNNSIYVLADKIRYVDYKYIRTRRSHQISEVDHSEYLAKILEKAQQGARLKDLAAVIVDDEIGIGDALAFITELVDAQLLKSELEPNVTGDNYFNVLLRKLVRLQDSHLEESNALGHIIHTLIQVDRQVKELDEKFNNPVEAYKHITQSVKQLPVKFEENSLFQTDLYLKTESGSVNKDLQKDLIKTIGFLSRLSSAPKETSLDRFMEAYYKRYEDAELPLLFVLDAELGIGYGKNKGGDHNPLIEGFMFHLDMEFMKMQQTESLSYSAVNAMLEKKLKEAYGSRSYQVNFTDDDLKTIPARDRPELPATFATSFSMPGGMDQIVLNFAAGGTCAATMLGRFAGGNADVLEISREIIEHENKFYGDKIVAEIAHLPESRTGNILMRPAFREYEIPYLASAFVADDKTIPLSDIFISVRNGSRVILRSKKLNKEIIPRLTNAHNFWFNALPVYQFLCELQLQDAKNSLSFDWGPFARQYQFKPRAVYSNVILKEASWDLKKEDLKELTENGFNRETIRQFLDTWQMPDMVCLADADNTLLVEWNNELSFNTFISSIKKRESGITLVEHIFNESAVKDKTGSSYENEFLAFFLNHDLPLQNSLPKVTELKKDIQRSFPIGSEWLYYKFYTGAQTADKVLTNYIKPLAEKLLAERWVDKWFFIRYADPDKHLRVRFHITDLTNYGHVINDVSASVNQLVDEKLVWKLQTDTYAREIERYGSLTMEACESYFFHDSVFVTDVINLIEGEEGETIRWISGLRAVDELLNNFGLGLDHKKLFMESLAGNFRKEHGDGKTLRVLLDNKFRELRKEIELNLNREKDAENDLKPIWDLLALKAGRTRELVTKIQELKQSRQLDTEYDQLIASLIHMMLNRLFKSLQRVHEMVIYDLLFHYYKSTIARMTKTKKQEAGTLEDSAHKILDQ